MLTLEYLRGIQLIYAFVTVVKTIFYRDVIRVMVIFGFVWIAFSCAMRIFITLVQTRSGSPATMTLASSVYEMFNTMLGHGALYDWTNAWSGDWTSTLRNDTIVVFSLIYSVFLLLATIVLLNVLIAMMNNTYQEVLKISDSLWNVECLQLVAWMTRDNFLGTRNLYYYFVKHFVLYRFEEKADGDAQSDENDKEKVEENGLGLDDVTDVMRGEVTDAKVAGDNNENNRKCVWAMKTSDLPPAVRKLWSKLFEHEPEQLTDNALEQNHFVTVVDANSLRLSAIESHLSALEKTMKKLCEKMDVSTDS
jgi:Ion transport protein